jgi:hypothetical protein
MQPVGPAAAADARGSGGARASVAGRGQRATDTPAPPRSGQEARQATFEKLVQSLRINAGTRTSTARLSLTPPELGRVQVDVRMQDQCLALVIRTETADARTLLQSRLEGLRNALAEHGVIVERVAWTGPADPRPDAALSDGGTAGGQNDSGTRGEQDASDQPLGTHPAREEPAPRPEGAGAASDNAAAETQLDIRA